MKFEWRIETLSNLSLKTTYGYTASAKDIQKNNEPKFLRITDIQGGVVNWENVPYCDIDDNKLDSYKLNFGDIVVARTGNSTGENYMFNSTETAVFASYLIRYVIDQDKAYPKFIWYQMRSNRWIGFINNVKGGSAQAGANAKTMGAFECVLPPLTTQKKIAHILSTLDDKIELNRKMNKTLEAMAQALFKSWFVDFDPVHVKAQAKSEQELEVAASKLGISKEILDLFPSEFEESEMEIIPKGWEVLTIGEKLNVLLGGTPSRRNAAYWTDGTISWINSGKVNEFRIIEASEMITEDAVAKSSTKLLPKKTTVLAITGATLGQVSLLEIDSCANQSVIGLPETKELNHSFIYPYICYAIKELMSHQTGGAQQHINKRNVEDFSMLIADERILKKYVSIVKPLMDTISNNSFEIEALEKTRDILLPKLLSGEIEV